MPAFMEWGKSRWGTIGLTPAWYLEKLGLDDDAAYQQAQARLKSWMAGLSAIIAENASKQAGMVGPFDEKQIDAAKRALSGLRKQAELDTAAGKTDTAPQRLADRLNAVPAVKPYPWATETQAMRDHAAALVLLERGAGDAAHGVKLLTAELEAGAKQREADAARIKELLKEGADINPLQAESDAAEAAMDKQIEHEKAMRDAAVEAGKLEEALEKLEQQDAFDKQADAIDRMADGLADLRRELAKAERALQEAAGFGAEDLQPLDKIGEMVGDPVARRRQRNRVEDAQEFEDKVAALQRGERPFLTAREKRRLAGLQADAAGVNRLAGQVRAGENAVAAAENALRAAEADRAAIAQAQDIAEMKDDIAKLRAIAEGK